MKKLTIAPCGLLKPCEGCDPAHCRTLEMVARIKKNGLKPQKGCEL